MADPVSAATGLSEHFLLAGVGSDVPFLNWLLLALPRDGYGQVFVEGTGPAPLHGWPGPAGVTPMRVRQDLAPARDGRLPQPGEALAEALRCWAAEWLPAPGDPSPVPLTLWVGAAGHAPIDRFCDELLDDHPWLHLHHPSGTSATGI